MIQRGFPPKGKRFGCVECGPAIPQNAPAYRGDSRGFSLWLRASLPTALVSNVQAEKPSSWFLPAPRPRVAPPPLSGL